MRKFTVLLSTIVMLALLLTACGGEETTTSIPSTNVPPVTVESTATEDMGATEAPSTGDLTTTPSVPVTGEDNPSRISNMMGFTVWNQSGEQVGQVHDFVLDLDNTRISYVVVGTAGFGDAGDKIVLIPWNQLQLQTGAGDTTGGQQNAFILLADPEFLQNAPDTDLNSVLPGMGQSAGNWDADLRNFWSTGQLPDGQMGTGTQSANTPAAGDNTMAAPEMTATSGTGGTTGTGNATATSSGNGTGTGTGKQGSGQKLQGVLMASEVIGSTITLGNGQGQGQGSSTTDSMATATTTVGTGTETTGTATTGTATTGTTGGTGTGNAGNAGSMTGTTGTIEDIIVDMATGDIQYLVLNTTFDSGDRWIPVPLSLLRWDAASNGFLFVANANALQNAPFFQEEQFPDTSTMGWDSDFSTFWQNNSGTGTTGSSSGGVTASTATATP